MRFSKICKLGLSIFLLVSIITGCGYQFVGDSSLLPKDARTIYVEPFVNRSRDIGMEKELTTALRSEFYRRGPLQVVDQSEQADVIVTGVVRSLESNVASVNRKDEVLQYESVLSLDVMLRRRQPDEILWRGQGLRLNDVYGGSRAAVVTTSSDFRTGTLNATDIRRMTDVQLTETERANLRSELMERFAKELHQRIMEMF
ncbi:MAG TPA: LptE family protein [Terriglobales bacterium]|nr:LptE family protein [Terriglobales bacterium]